MLALVAALLSSANPAFFVPNGAQTMNVGGVIITLTPALPVVERATSMPVTVHTEGAFTDELRLWGCLDWTCDVREEHVLHPNTDVELLLPMWGQTLQVRARMGQNEQSCCRQPDRPVTVVLIAGSTFAGTMLDFEAGDSLAPTQLWVTGAGTALRDHPDLLDAVRGLVVVPSGLRPEQRAHFVASGGALVDIAASDVENPTGAARALIAANPALLRPPSVGYEPPHLAVVRAAAASTAVRANAGVEFTVVLAGLVVGIVALWRSRRIGWRRALTIALAASVASGVGVVVLKPLLVPAMNRQRVVAWMGAGGWIEIGVDAARPRSGTVEVDLHGPVPLLGTVTLGNGAATSTAKLDASRTHAVVNASADAGVGALWRRPSPMPNAVRMDSEGTLENGLDEPLAFVLFNDGDAIAFNVQPHMHVARSSAKHRNGWEPLVDEGVLPAEERLVRELLQQCRSTTGDTCAVALVRRPGEILAIEVRR